MAKTKKERTDIEKWREIEKKSRKMREKEYSRK